ncbi:hypothetical protein NP493_1850g00010 [Ridgeia piscesae]|uniref:Uncharacterized protein n=1 Tax=Ridgeia piscesae TaxID=27915 RepID=A0AAD9JTC3_RIDPI|nr:hypothetical protein NP493_1850g00010 [Ridgeia piscesae]
MEEVPYAPDIFLSWSQEAAQHREHVDLQYYDSDTKLVSSRVLILPGSDYMRRFGHGYLTIVTDYNDGRSPSWSREYQ